MRNTVWRLPIVAVLCLCIAMGVGVVASWSLQSRNYKNDAWIARQEESGGSWLWSSTSLSAESTQLEVNNLKGARTYWILEVGPDGANIHFDYEQQVTGGRFKLVMVENHAVVHHMAEGTGSGRFERDLAPGRYVVRAVGVHASARCEFALKASGEYRALQPGGVFDDASVVAVQPLDGVEKGIANLENTVKQSS